jgi:hypothetical protein
MELRLRYWHAFTGATYWDDVSVTHIGGSALVTAAEDVPGDGDAASARQTWLLPNVPNPAREATTVRFALPQAAEVTLEVYDLLGRRVALLLDGERLAANTHEVLFNASDLSGGTYVVVLRTDAHTEARTVVIAR